MDTLHISFVTAGGIKKFSGCLLFTSTATASHATANPHLSLFILLSQLQERKKGRWDKRKARKTGQKEGKDGVIWCSKKHSIELQLMDPMACGLFVKHVQTMIPLPDKSQHRAANLDLGFRSTAGIMNSLNMIDTSCYIWYAYGRLCATNKHVLPVRSSVKNLPYVSLL